MLKPGSRADSVGPRTVPVRSGLSGPETSSFSQPAQANPVLRTGAVRGPFRTMKKPAVADVLPTHTPALFEAAVARAWELLRAGELVALPTETVYGLAANALDARAVAKIFEVKGRPAHNPIIVHVGSVAMAGRCVTAWPEIAERLAKAFWPGPLTLVLPRSAAIPDSVTAGGATVGVRQPAHPFIQAVIEACDFPLAAPSANLSTRVSPTNAMHVKKSLGNKIRLIVKAQCGTRAGKL